MVAKSKVLNDFRDMKKILRDPILLITIIFVIIILLTFLLFTLIFRIK